VRALTTFGERLARLRKISKLSQSELSSRLKIAKSTLAMYETNKREPSFETIEKIANYFNTSTDYLLGRSEDSNPKKTYYELLNQYIQQSGLTINEIHDEFEKLKPKEVGATNSFSDITLEYLSSLTKGTLPPPIDFVSQELARITSGDPTKLVWAAILETSSDETINMISKNSDLIEILDKIVIRYLQKVDSIKEDKLLLKVLNIEKDDALLLDFWEDIFSKIKKNNELSSTFSTSFKINLFCELTNYGENILMIDDSNENVDSTIKKIIYSDSELSTSEKLDLAEDLLDYYYSRRDRIINRRKKT
jgi:transcriptional regulator with XRE-family HTH domain